MGFGPEFFWGYQTIHAAAPRDGGLTEAATPPVCRVFFVWGGFSGLREMEEMR